jgi:hypothetical protein
MSAPFSVSAVLRDARMQVCTAHVSGGPDAALAAVAAGSIRLFRYVSEGELLWSAAFKALLSVSVNLKLPIIYGRRIVRAAIYAGPTFYSDIAEAA